MQLAVPIAVNAAVRIDTINCITVFHVSFFIVLPFLLNSFNKLIFNKQKPIKPLLRS